MKVFTAVTLYDGEPTVFVSLNKVNLYDQVWDAIVEDYFEDLVGRAPYRQESNEQRVDLYFKTLQKKERYNESIFFSEEELSGVQAYSADLFSGTLNSILTAINGLEGLEKEHLVQQQRAVLYDFKNMLGSLNKFGTNKALKAFDAVFVESGWDENGLRWTKEKRDDEEDIFIVEFTNKTKTKWRVA